MDVNKKVQLDPKLKDAYDRVMGFTPPELNKASTPPVIPKAADTPPAQSVSTTIATSPRMTAPIPHHDLPPAQTGSVKVAKDHSKNEEKPDDKKEETGEKKETIQPLFIGIAGIVFFAVYAFLWSKILDIQLPF